MPHDDQPSAAPPLQVRAATAADAAAIGALQLRAWQTGYAERLPAGALADLTADGLAARWQAAVAGPPTPVHRVLVGLDGPEVVGFAAVGPAADPDLAPDPGSVGDPAPGSGAGELLILAVDPDAGRRGHGSRLLNAAMDHLRTDGFALAVTWVLSSDDALRGFLVSSGWAADGAWRELATGSGETIKQVRLHTALAA